MNEKRIVSKVAAVATVEEFLRLLRSGDYGWMALFQGKRKIGKQPTRSGRMGPVDDDHMKAAVVEPVSLQELPQGLVFTFIGTVGRPDTYVFTKVPFEEAFAESGAVAPKRSVRDIAVEVGKKLEALGLSNLGARHAKAGEQYGFGDSARRVAVGSRDLLLNYLHVEQRVGEKQQGSRWNLWKDFLLSKVDDGIIEGAVEWVKRGPKMTEVRQACREKAIRELRDGGTEGYGFAVVTGIDKGV